ncbi:MAG: tetratricopeptide repeat protein [Pseudomonadota bacterium]
MSLLIKALAAAEKDKQLETSKQQTGEYAVDDALSFELASSPIKADQAEADQIDAFAEFSEDSARQKYEDEFDFVLSETPYTDSHLSLEEEAGLPLDVLTTGKYGTSALNLDKAENLASKPIVSNFGAQVSTVATEVSQKAAAKVFVANQSAQAPTSKATLALLGGAGALMIWLGLQGYTYLQTPTVPKVVVVKPVLPPPVQVAVSEPASVTEAAPLSKGAMEAGNDRQNNTSATSAPSEQDSDNQTISSKNEAVKSDAAKEKTPLAFNKTVAKLDADAYSPDNEVPKKAALRKPANSDDVVQSDRETSSRHAPVRLVSKVPSAGVDPTLLSAYQAFTRGEDTLAQQQYRQVLQHDVRNVDALLGMAAIAQRQGRDADAAGWYQKVLEVEPRNSIAQSAIASPQSGTDAVASESRIKSMLVQQPDAANLHAALGNVYAEQNQWASAQEAYFNASRYAPNNADYVFNLAISLDQLGKSNLALKQYQRALELVHKSGATSPDRVALEARIQALQ